MDFNTLELMSSSLKKSGRWKDALRVYFFMADGDQSLDAGYLGLKIAECYEQLGDLTAAKYWYGRAVEEGLDAWPLAKEGCSRLAKEMEINDLVGEFKKSNI